MDSIPDRSNWPRLVFRDIPEDIIIYILDFLDSTTLAALALANRCLQELTTPSLYRRITIPKKEGKDIEHQESAARLIRTLSRRPSLTVYVRQLENAPPSIQLRVLMRVFPKRSGPSDSQMECGAGATRTPAQLYRIPIKVMKSCVNLRSLTVAGTIPSYLLDDVTTWLGVLRDPSIQIKDLKLLVYPVGLLLEIAWNRIVSRILDVQLSLEYLEFPFFKNTIFRIKRRRMNKWAPKLITLGGSQVNGFKGLLSNKRSIETVVVRSIPMGDIPPFFGAQLKNVDTIKEIVYRGPEEERINFGGLFSTVPSLRIYRGEMWLNCPLEDLFSKELPRAFASTPHLTEFDLRGYKLPPMHASPIIQPEVIINDLASPDQEWPRDQGALLKQYSALCPELRVFTFPDGRRWVRMKDGWKFQDKFTRKYFGEC